MSERPRVGVSRCLLGDAVRYDGQSKPCRIVIDRLADLFQLIPVCPEVEAGLTTPRPPVRLTGSLEQPSLEQLRLTGRDDPALDITDLMRDYCRKKIPELDGLSGFICKSRSPSCGLHSTPVFFDDACVSETASGVFTRALQATYPQLPLIEETTLESPAALENFIHAVFCYHAARHSR